MGVDGVRYVRIKVLIIGMCIVVINYEMMGYLDGIDWVGIIFDEFSILILKNF
jgi:hypothetical protein